MDRRDEGSGQQKLVDDVQAYENERSRCEPVLCLEKTYFYCWLHTSHHQHCHDMLLLFKFSFTG